MADWYYSSDNKRMGPVSQAELKNLAASGQLEPTDLVWTDGMPDWASAHQVSGLSFGDEGKQDGPEPAPFAFTADRPLPSLGKQEEKRSPDWNDDAARRTDFDDDRPRRGRWDSDDRPRRRGKKRSDAKIATIVVLFVVVGFGVLLVLGMMAGRLGKDRVAPAPAAAAPGPMGQMPLQPNQPQVRGRGALNGPFPLARKNQKLSSEVVPLPLDEVRNGDQAKLTVDDAVDRFWQKCYCKVYLYPMVARQSYVIDMETKDFYACLRLEDPHGMPLLQDPHVIFLDVKGGGKNARILFTAFETGSFRIIASTFQEEATGSYLVRVNPTAAWFPKRQGQKDWTEVEPIRLTGKQLSWHGTLTDNDAVGHFRGGACCKVYTYPMVKGRTYSIKMESGALDAYLRLEDPTGTVLTEDDDSGGGINRQDAQIVYTADQTGAYRIVATTFDPIQRGAYMLWINPVR